MERRLRIFIAPYALCAAALLACAVTGSPACDSLVAEAVKAFRSIDPASSDTTTMFKNTVLCANLETIYTVKHQVFDVWAEEGGNPEVDAARAASIRMLTGLIHNTDPARVDCGCEAVDAGGRGGGSSANAPPAPAESTVTDEDLQSATTSVRKLLPEGAHRWDLKLVERNPVLVHLPNDPDQPPLVLPCGFFGASLAQGPDGSPNSALVFHGRHLDGLEISSISGLAVGSNWALDVWVQYDPERLRHAEVTLLDGYADWIKGGDYEIRAVNLELTIYAGDVDHGTGLHLPHSSSWHRFTMACSSSNMVWYVNGTKLGAVRAHMLLRDPGEKRERASAVHTLGGSVTALDRGSGASWLGQIWGAVVFTDADQSADMAVTRKNKADVIRATALANLVDQNAWAKGLAHRRVILVGNSAQLLADNTRRGNLIDQFDEVVRFNANPIDGLETSLGSRRNVEVLTSLSDLCGCPLGDCCNPHQRTQLWNMMRPRRQPMPTSLVLLSQELAQQEWFRTGTVKFGIPNRVATIPDYCGPAFNHWAEQHSVATRFPQWMTCRSGFRMLLLLLAHGGMPTVTGFDQRDRTHGRYAAMREEDNKDEDRNAYYLEQQAVTELIRVQLVKAV